ncbi:MAG: hypothetical protein M3R53_06250 [Candidatus Eremiobacteraeota bacterium]|nr:hypothetical protein [Candidatus Eremiobacteraeota bacterium]
MSHLEQRLSVACPLAQAARQLKRFFDAHEGPDPDTVTLKLGMNVRVPGSSIPLTLQRGVVANIRAHHLPADMTPRYSVHWAPAQPGPFPDFDGELIIEGNDDYDTFALHLRGDYTPPGGLLGRGFDAAIGNRVAQATAIDLLAEIKDAIESDFRASEAAKDRPNA